MNNIFWSFTLFSSSFFDREYFFGSSFFFFLVKLSGYPRRRQNRWPIGTKCDVCWNDPCGVSKDPWSLVKWSWSQINDKATMSTLNWPATVKLAAIVWIWKIHAFVTRVRPFNRRRGCKRRRRRKLIGDKQWTSPVKLQVMLIWKLNNIYRANISFFAVENGQMPMPMPMGAAMMNGMIVPEGNMIPTATASVPTVGNVITLRKFIFFFLFFGKNVTMLDFFL